MNAHRVAIAEEREEKKQPTLERSIQSSVKKDNNVNMNPINQTSSKVQPASSRDHSFTNSTSSSIQQPQSNMKVEEQPSSAIKKTSASTNVAHASSTESTETKKQKGLATTTRQQAKSEMIKPNDRGK